MKPPKTSSKTPEELAATAEGLFRQQAYKEAIVLYKDLLKQEQRPEWQARLGEAYLQRALAVAAKGLILEACVLWENHAGLCRPPQHADTYAGWLLQTTNVAKLGAVLKQRPELLDAAQGASPLAETLGALVLDNNKLLAQLPGDSALVKHYPLARQALQAYATQDDAQIEAALRQIPIRSPYRDLRTLLKALLLQDSDPAAAKTALEKIAAASPYRPLADAVTLQGWQDPQFMERYAAWEPALQAFCQRRYGLDKTQIGLLRDLQKLTRHYSHKQAFDLALTYRQRLGDARCRKLCRDLLPFYAAGSKIFEKTFGPLSPFEANRIAALQQETSHEQQMSGRYWRKCLEQLKKAPQTAEQRLQSALILRHLAAIEEHENPAHAINYLKDSLALDEDDKPCYLRLLGLLERRKQTNDYKTWLDKALQQYPRDVDVLKLAMRAAAAAKAFKKAAGYAQTLLEVDSINAHAKQVLIRCHAAHARKLIAADKYVLALKELTQARHIEQNRRSGRLEVLEGLAALKQGDKSRAETLLCEGFALSGGALAGEFCVSAEALGLKLPVPDALKLSSKSQHSLLELLPGVDRHEPVTRQNLDALWVLLAQYQQENGSMATAALKRIDIPLREALKKQRYTESEWSDLCWELNRLEQYPLLEYCAGLAVKAHPPTILFRYFQVYARCRGLPDKLSHKDMDYLLDALQMARQHEDKRAAALITELMQKYLYEEIEDKLKGIKGIEEEDDLFDDLSMRDAMEELAEELDRINGLPPAKFIKALGEYGISRATLESMGTEQELSLLVITTLCQKAGVDPVRFIREFGYSY